jgi:RNA polymerase sigma-70 factor (ECF subfamily)
LCDFAGIYDEHALRVYGFFAARLSARPEAEDLTQQTFERALRAWATYDASRASPATWLLTIARNLLVDHLRARRPGLRLSLDALELEPLAAPPDRHRLGLEPELERALRQLGPRERELIALRFGGDLNGPEIAQLTGLSLANVQQILSRSLRRMRASLEGAALAASRGAGPG